MKLIIDIPEDIYKNIVKNGFIYDEDNEIVTYVIKNGTPLPKEIQALQQIRDIVNSPVYIQEDVLKYQMICDVLNDEE